VGDSREQMVEAMGRSYQQLVMTNIAIEHGDRNSGFTH
jgi:hypothetical protein